MTDDANTSPTATGFSAGRDMDFSIANDFVGGDKFSGNKYVSYMTGNLVVNQNGVQASTLYYRHVLPLGDGYVDRPELEQQLEEALLSESEQQKLVLVNGRPGTGRSTLVYKVVTQSYIEAAFPDGTLLGNLRSAPLNEILDRFVFTYETEGHYTSNSKWDQATHLRELLTGKRVVIILDNVTSTDELAFFDHEDNNVTIIAITRAHLPQLDENAWSIHRLNVPEMNDSESLALFKSIWQEAPLLANVDSDILRQLAHELHFLPQSMKSVARDILRRQIPPEEYLKNLQQQQGAGQDAHLASFQTIYSQLPAEGQAILPFLGVLNTGHITAEGLMAISRFPRHEVETALRQLVQIAFIDQIIESDGVEPYYKVPSVTRDFAKIELLNQHGEHMLRVVRALMAKHYLRIGEDEIETYRRTLLEHFLQSHENQDALTDYIKQTVADRSRTSLLETVSGEDVNWQSVVGLGIMQDAFETLVLEIEEYSVWWSKLLSAPVNFHLLIHLRDAFALAVEQEDWNMVRRFGMLDLGGLIRHRQLTGPVTLQLSFVLGRDVVVKDASLQEFDLEASRLISTRWENCIFLSGKWHGVVLRNTVMKHMDMVGATMLATTFYESTLIDIDFRNSNLRGATFFRCRLNKVNFRNADLTGAVFVECIWQNVDFRHAVMKDYVFYQCMGPHQL